MQGPPPWYRSCKMANATAPLTVGNARNPTPMSFFTRLINFITLGSEAPFRRLFAYYLALALAFVLLYRFFPAIDSVMSGDRLAQLAKTPSLLQDGLSTGQIQAPVASIQSRVEFAASTPFVFVSTLALMLPVTWVYMSARSGHGHNQSVVQALIVLPMIVAGIVLIVSNSLALAFSLGGVVAAVRFRTNLSDARDIVFIFLAIAVGFAAGVQEITIALMLSILFNFVLVLIWRYDFGRAVLEPTAAADWAEPLQRSRGKGSRRHTVPDRDLVLALTPKKVEALAERFDRVSAMLGPNGKKPKYDAVSRSRRTSLRGAETHRAGARQGHQAVEARRGGDQHGQTVGALLSSCGRGSRSPRDAMVTAIRSQRQRHHRPTWTSRSATRWRQGARRGTTTSAKRAGRGPTDDAARHAASLAMCLARRLGVCQRGTDDLATDGQRVVAVARETRLQKALGQQRCRSWQTTPLARWILPRAAPRNLRVSR